MFSKEELNNLLVAINRASWTGHEIELITALKLKVSEKLVSASSVDAPEAGQ